MDDGRKRNSIGARAAAAAALAVAAIVVVVALGSSFGGGESEPPPGPGAATPSGGGSGGAQGPATYEVQEGDTLTAIAAETGVSVARIEALNPGLDPQALTPGQELRLR
jgi:hypothetical protein